MINETLNIIDKRRSHRAYEKTPLTQEQVDTLLKAALASPSAMNRQSWHFTLVRNRKLLDEIHAAARENALKRPPEQRSPRFDDEAFDVFYHAPAVIFISAQLENPYALIDCGIAVENIALAAESIGLGSVILGLPREAFHTEKADQFRRELHFPAGWDYVIAIAVGVPKDEKAAHPVGEGKISFVD